VLSNTIRPFAVKINGIAPRRPIQIGEVGAEFPEIISFRADVVIHHIQHDSNSLGMTGVYQLFQTLSSTVGMLYSIGENAIITPVSTSGKLGHRHELNRIDAKFRQVVQMVNNSFKSALRGKCADM